MSHTDEFVVQPGLWLPLYGEKVNGHTGESDGDANARLIGAHVEGKEDEEEAGNEEDNRKEQIDFDGSLQIGLFVAQPEEGSHRGGHRQRLNEGGVVDEHVDLRRRQVWQRQDALHTKKSRRYFTLVSRTGDVYGDCALLSFGDGRSTVPPNWGYRNHLVAGASNAIRTDVTFTFNTFFLFYFL